MRPCHPLPRLRSSPSRRCSARARTRRGRSCCPRSRGDRVLHALRRGRHARAHLPRRGEPQGRPARADPRARPQRGRSPSRTSATTATTASTSGPCCGPLAPNAAAGGIEQGGSTITQQYVKQEILRDDSQTVERKVQEAPLAVQLERRLLQGPHPRALPERHLLRERRLRHRGRRPPVLRQAGHRAHPGRGRADRRPHPAARRHRPVRRSPEVALERRQLVLDRMLANDFAHRRRVALAPATPRCSSPRRWCPAAERYQAAYFVEEVKQWILDDPRFGATPKERRDLLFGGGPADPHHRRPRRAGQGRGGRQRDPPRPGRPGGVPRRRSSPAPATCGPWSAAATSSAPARSPSSTWPRRAAARPARPSSRFVLATALAAGHRPARPASRRPACITIPLRERAAVAALQLRRRRRRHRHHRRGHRPLLQHALRPADDARRPEGGHGHGHPARHPRARSSRTRPPCSAPTT